MKELLFTPVFALTLSFGVFLAAQKLYQRFRTPLLNPVLISILSVIIFLKLFSIEYSLYFEGAKVLHFLLGLSVVALGAILHSQVDTIRKYWREIIISISAGSIIGILSAAFTAYFLHATPSIILSLAPKSATAPISMGIAEKTGGIPALTGAVTIAVGVLGAVIGPLFLRSIGVRSRSAFGLAIGAASHGIGTARALEEGESEGAASALALCLNGIITAFLDPLIMKYFFAWLQL